MISEQREKQLLDLEKKIGVSFLSKTLLDQSLTHSSFAYETHEKVPDNERLEFLGDAVLKLVMSEYLYNKFPDRQEGELTKIRASVISDATLASVAQKMKLGSYLLLGQNEKVTGGANRKSNVANAFESLLGAVYLDAGLGKARDLVLSLLSEEVDKVSKEGYIMDFKSALQEYVQKKGWGLPIYKVIGESGPRHKRIFLTEVKVKGRSMGVGRGTSKKESEQAAAKVAMSRIPKFQQKPGKMAKKVEAVKGLISAVKKKVNFQRRRPE